MSGSDKRGSTVYTFFMFTLRNDTIFVVYFVWEGEEN